MGHKYRTATARQCARRLMANRFNVIITSILFSLSAIIMHTLIGCFSLYGIMQCNYFVLIALGTIKLGNTFIHSTTKPMTVGARGTAKIIVMDSQDIKEVEDDVRNTNEERRKSQKLLAKDQLEDFAQNTTLHGLRYVTDRKLSGAEKLFWLLTFLISIGMCSFLILNVWTKWRTSPVIVSINEQLVPVEMVPFPSVTICPQMKTKSTVYNYTAEKINYERMLPHYFANETIGTSESKEKFEDIALLCRDYAYHLRPSRNYCNSSVVKHMFEVSPTREDIFVWCNWRNTLLDCTDLFHYVLTQEGVCFTMNTLSAEEHFNVDNLHHDYEFLSSSINRSEGWSLAQGYEKKVMDPYPRRGRPNGGEPDLKVILYEKSQERDVNCNMLNTGYKVYVHHPADYPQASMYYHGVSPGQLTSAAVSFSVISTAENLRQYPPDVRQCYFPSERYLRYFSVYTADNCRLECITNYTLEHCGCIGFHMPFDNSSRICIQGYNYCMTEAQEILAQQNLDPDLKSKACDCLPACDSVDYDAEIYKSDIKMRDYLKTNWAFSAINTTYSQLEVYFKKPRFVSMRRSELFGTTDFLANCGGLLGLFLGFSFLSLVEIFYFITLRFWCTLKRDGEYQKRTENQKDGHNK